MALKQLGDQQIQVGVYLSEGTYTAVVDASIDPAVPVASSPIGQGASYQEALEALAKRLSQDD